MHLFALHLRRTVLGLRLKRIEREFVIKDDIGHTRIPAVWLVRLGPFAWGRP